MKPQSDNRYLQIYILFFIASAICLFIIKDYLTSIILGSFIAILTTPLFNMLLRVTAKFHWKNFISLFYKNKSEVDGNKVLAALSTVLISLGIITLLISLVGTITGSSLKVAFNQPIDEGIYSIMSNPTFKSNFGQFYDEKDAKQRISQFLDQYKPSAIITKQSNNIITNNESRVTIGKYISSFFTNLFSFLIYLIIFMFTWIVMLINGKDLIKFLYKFAFLTPEEQGIISVDVTTAIKNVLIGNAVSGLIIAFTVAGLCVFFKIPLVAVWAILSFFIGFLPLTPSEIAYLPVLIGVFFTSGLQTTIILAICIELYILVLNNAVLPKITAGKETNPLLILISVFTAINVFGFAGFVIGPVFVYLLMAIYKIADKRRQELSLNQ
jgi:predicted PurR-regulated permease PerM